jgi:RNA polymerase sigma-70 factor (ECF subfamily)
MHDDQLRLIFTCCHPGLRVEHQVALTLRLVAGLTVTEIARAFLVSEATMAKRLVRAKYKIKTAHIPYRIPSDADLPVRLRTVLSVVYLVYNAGADSRERADLRGEAIRLGRVLARLMPDEPEVAGLLALMLLSEARVPAQGGASDLVILRDQDRALWDRVLISEGHDIVRTCIRRGLPGPFQLQAAIQAVHCAAPTFSGTDWRQIVALYDQLFVIMPTPVVALNRAIAVAETSGPHVALAQLDERAADLAGYHLLHATRGTMLRRVGRDAEASTAFDQAVALAPTVRERDFLERQREALARLG